jgi:hypothetical protein
MKQRVPVRKTPSLDCARLQILYQLSRQASLESKFSHSRSSKAIHQKAPTLQPIHSKQQKQHKEKTDKKQQKRSKKMLDLLADPQKTAIAIAYTFDLRLSPDETCTRLSITRKSLDTLVRYVREQTVPTDGLQTLLNITDPQKRQISPGSKVSLALRDGIREDAKMKSGFGVVSAVRSTLVELQGFVS